MKYLYLLPALVALPAFLPAQILVDFNGPTAYNEPGFLAVTVPPSSSSPLSDFAIGDGILLSVQGYWNHGGRTRNANNLTAHPDFFRDGATGSRYGDTTNPEARALDFVFSGLSANTDYTLGFWSWDNQYNNNGNHVDFVNTTGGASDLVGTVDLQGVRPASLSDAYTEFTLTSDASGIISLDVFGRADSPSGQPGVLINGLTIIPEPSTVALITAAFAMGIVVVLRRRR